MNIEQLRNAWIEAGQTRGSFYQICIRSGFLTPNDVRILEDLPPDNDPNANKLWVSGDLYTIDTPASERKGGVFHRARKTFRKRFACQKN